MANIQGMAWYKSLQKGAWVKLWNSVMGFVSEEILTISKIGKCFLLWKKLQFFQKKKCTEYTKYQLRIFYDFG